MRRPKDQSLVGYVLQVGHPLGEDVASRTAEGIGAFRIQIRVPGFGFYLDEIEAVSLFNKDVDADQHSLHEDGCLKEGHVLLLKVMIGDSNRLIHVESVDQDTAWMKDLGIFAHHVAAISQHFHIKIVVQPWRDNPASYNKALWNNQLPP